MSSNSLINTKYFLKMRVWFRDLLKPDFKKENQLISDFNIQIHMYFPKLSMGQDV